MSRLPMTSVLHNHKYLTPRHVIHMVKRAQHVCHTESYLNCVCEWAEVQVVTTKFALALNRPDIHSPYAFVEAYVRQYPELLSPDV